MARVTRRTTGALLKLVVFAAVTIPLTAVLASIIGNISFADTATYRARFTDATGLVVGDDVRIAGVKVGQVDAVRLVDRRYAEVEFGVAKQTSVHRSVQAQIRYTDLLGDRYLQLSDAAGPGAVLPPGALIPLAQTAPALDLTVLFNGFKPLFQALSPGDVNKLAAEIVATLQGEGGTIDTLLASTASLTNTIADKDAVVGAVVNNLNTVLATVAQRDNTLSELIAQLRRLTTGLAADRTTIGTSLGSIDALASDTAGLLSATRPSLQPDIAQLAALATNLNKDKGFLDTTLQQYPVRLNNLVRSASYGSWFNFFFCSGNGVVTLPSGQQVTSPAVTADLAVCGT